MTDPQIEQLLSRAVHESYEAWAAEHPTLASVIDQINLTTRAAARLRETGEYRRAVAAYHQNNSESQFMEALLELAGPVLAAILGA